MHHFRPKFSFKSQWRPKYPAFSSCGCLALGASSGALSGAGSFNFFRAYLKRLERQLENRTNHTISNQKVVILTNDKQFNSDKRGAKFTGKACLVPRSDEFECQGQMSKSPGTKIGIFRPFRRPVCSLCLVKHLWPLVLFFSVFGSVM